MNNTIYKKNMLYRLRKLGNKSILFGGDVCLELNEVGVKVWNYLNGADSLDVIIKKISEEYQVDVKDIVDGIETYVQGLLEDGVVRKISEV